MSIGLNPAAMTDSEKDRIYALEVSKAPFLTKPPCFLTASAPATPAQRYYDGRIRKTVVPKDSLERSHRQFPQLHVQVLNVILLSKDVGKLPQADHAIVLAHKPPAGGIPRLDHLPGHG